MRRLVVFGNCQAGGIFFSLNYAVGQCPDLDYELKFVDGNVPTALNDLDAALEGADMLIYQGRTEFPTPPSSFNKPVFRLPTIYFRTLWPNDGDDPKVNALDGAQPPVPRGDAYIYKLISEGLSAREIYDRYISEDFSKLMDLDALFLKELERQDEKDKSSDVAIAGYIESHLKSSRLFSMAWHPTNLLLDHYLDQPALWQFLNFSNDAIAKAKFFFTGPEVLLPDVPIHPSIIEHFGISWAPTHYSHFGEARTFNDWLLTYLEIHDADIRSKVA